MAQDAVPPPPPLPAAAAQDPPSPPPSRTGRIVLIVVVALLVVVAGCSTLLYLGGSRLVGAARAPVDTANDFLDGARAEQGGDDLACPGTAPVTADLARSEAQDLSSVHIDGQGAVVSGTITLQDGQRSPVTLELRRHDDGWCVASGRLAPPPGDSSEAPW